MKGSAYRPGQTYLGTKLSQTLFDAVEKASAGYKSQFVREAIAEKLAAAGHVIAEHLIKAPSRKGKGGPKKFTRTRGHAKRKKI